MKIIQVAGFSNSGKTTLIEKLVVRLQNEDIRVSVIKHHGHENRLATLDNGKDSARFREAGAQGTTVVAGNTVQIHFNNENKWSVDDALRLQQFINIDVVIIEGFKTEPFPKVVIIRRDDDLQLLKQLENIQAVLLWDNIKLTTQLKVPTFLLDDIDVFFNWFMNNVLEENDE
ncbi:molybdopterin-guanine dinucleotide biosynthesis protein B [Alkalihalobacterium elongatum]|uniref:molybdopterin-guanine dinucleotide biosynthesis protein B n=1 Tax=Alkalihalobacterium elongatum TaxID=2675466 RepID=UPI001C1F43D3|nr:molybdopterin-guanine dinucleotide biosynthesis protein B [Alkalihalobacterium elongatum]